MFRVAIICMSDKGFKDEREDISTKVIEEIVVNNGYEVVKKLLSQMNMKR